MYFNCCTNEAQGMAVPGASYARCYLSFRFTEINCFLQGKNRNAESAPEEKAMTALFSREKYVFITFFAGSWVLLWGTKIAAHCAPHLIIKGCNYLFFFNRPIWPALMP